MLGLTRVVGVIVVSRRRETQSGGGREAFAMAFGRLFFTVVCIWRCGDHIGRTGSASIYSKDGFDVRRNWEIWNIILELRLMALAVVRKMTRVGEVTKW